MTGANQNEPIEILSVDQVPPNEQPADSAPADTPPDEDRSDREAMRYRLRLREAEGQRDALIGLVEQGQRALVDQYVHAAGYRPEAIWAAGITLADVQDEDGTVDPAKIAAACEYAANVLGLSRRPRPDMSQGSNGNSPHGPANWQQLLNSREAPRGPDLG